jgi:hypothetical protein
LMHSLGALHCPFVVRQHILVVLYWCLLAPPWCPLLVLVGALFVMLCWCSSTLVATLTSGLQLNVEGKGS